MSDLPVLPPLEIEVSENSWLAFADPNEPLSEMTFKQLVHDGGISDTVEPGIYIYTVEYLDAEHVHVTLEPKEV